VEVEVEVEQEQEQDEGNTEHGDKGPQQEMNDETSPARQS